jgi:hypothetical protein
LLLLSVLNRKGVAGVSGAGAGAGDADDALPNALFAVFAFRKLPPQEAMKGL